MCRSLRHGASVSETSSGRRSLRQSAARLGEMEARRQGPPKPLLFDHDTDRLIWTSLTLSPTAQCPYHIDNVQCVTHSATPQKPQRAEPQKAKPQNVRSPQRCSRHTFPDMPPRSVHHHTLTRQRNSLVSAGRFMITRRQKLNFFLSTTFVLSSSRIMSVLTSTDLMMLRSCRLRAE